MGAYMKFEGGRVTIKGDVRKGPYFDWLTLTSVSFGESRRIARDRDREDRGRLVVSELQVTMPESAASPILFLAASRGDSFPLVRIEMVKDTDPPEPYLRVALHEVFISSYQQAGSGGQPPMVALTLNFKTLESTHIPQAEGKSYTLMQFDLDTAVRP